MKVIIIPYCHTTVNDKGQGNTFFVSECDPHDLCLLVSLVAINLYVCIMFVVRCMHIDFLAPAVCALTWLLEKWLHIGMIDNHGMKPAVFLECFLLPRRMEGKHARVSKSANMPLLQSLQTTTVVSQ